MKVQLFLIVSVSLLTSFTYGSTSKCFVHCIDSDQVLVNFKPVLCGECSDYRRFLVFRELSFSASESTLKGASESTLYFQLFLLCTFISFLVLKCKDFSLSGLTKSTAILNFFHSPFITIQLLKVN